MGTIVILLKLVPPSILFYPNLELHVFHYGRMSAQVGHFPRNQIQVHIQFVLTRQIHRDAGSDQPANDLVRAAGTGLWSPCRACALSCRPLPGLPLRGFRRCLP